jgi:hypothetical protein
MNSHTHRVASRKGTALFDPWGHSKDTPWVKSNSSDVKETRARPNTYKFVSLRDVISLHIDKSIKLICGRVSLCRLSSLRIRYSCSD